MGGYANGGDAENSTSTDPQHRLGGDEGPYVLNPVEIIAIAVTITSFLLVLFLIFYYRKLQARRKLDMMTKAAAALENGTHPSSRKNSATPAAPGTSGGSTAGGAESIELKDGASSSTATSVSIATTTTGNVPVPVPPGGSRPNTPAAPPLPAKDKARGGGRDATAAAGGGGNPRVLIVSEHGHGNNDPFTTPSSSTNNVATAAAAAAAARISCPPPPVVVVMAATTRTTTTTTITAGEKPPLWKYIHWKGDPKKESKKNANATLLPSVEPRHPRRGSSNGLVQGKYEYFPSRARVLSALLSLLSFCGNGMGANLEALVETTDKDDETPIPPKTYYA
ncbi:hypothetical protein QBC37DRAFT_44510 [Rhypophila decipiens]|uniref:Uncharacterized protein n=1 Tax=Rhypophila decipiens TaxID=261697 RepID=A0AAN7B3T3_9PEZI|nr:hypothetical protein QBC37DRAFT_44510 [Rhypophila decipiens]